MFVYYIVERHLTLQYKLYYSDSIDSSCALVPPDRFTIGIYINLQDDPGLTIDIPQFYVIIAAIWFLINSNSQFKINKKRIVWLTCTILYVNILWCWNNGRSWVPKHIMLKFGYDRTWQGYLWHFWCTSTTVYNNNNQLSQYFTFLHQNVCVK